MIEGEQKPRSLDQPQFGMLARHALEMIPDGSVVGLGTGRAATAFIHALGERVRDGLRVRGIPTSRTSEQLARNLCIPLTTFDELDDIDVDVDGADEVDPQCNLIKGYGGALLREKIVAAASRRVVILVGSEKCVPVLGTRGKLPIEVVPFALPLLIRRLAARGLAPQPRVENGNLFVSDNGNHLLDCAVSLLDQPQQIEKALRAIPGVVGTGLFLGMAHDVLIQNGETVEIRSTAR